LTYACTREDNVDQEIASELSLEQEKRKNVLSFPQAFYLKITGQQRVKNKRTILTTCALSYTYVQETRSQPTDERESANGTNVGLFFVNFLLVGV